jgi:hypothetical protein
MMLLRVVVSLALLKVLLSFKWNNIATGRVTRQKHSEIGLYRDLSRFGVVAENNEHELTLLETKCKDAAPSMGFSYSVAKAQGKNRQQMSSRGPGLREVRDQKKSLTALGMGVLDDIKKIVAGGDPNEILAAENEDQVKKYMQVVESINNLEEEYEKLSDDDLKAKTDQFRAKLDAGATLDSLLVEAFAVVSAFSLSSLVVFFLNFHDTLSLTFCLSITPFLPFV